MAVTTAGTKTIKDSAGANVVVKTVVDSGDSTTSPSHGIIDGQGNQFDPSGKVFVGSSFTRPANTTAYTAGDLVANSTTAGSVVVPTIQIARFNDQIMTLLRMRIRKSSTTMLDAQMRIHLFRASPTVANGDNGVLSFDQAANYVGSFDLNSGRNFTDGTVFTGTPTAGSVIVTRPVSGGTTLYYLIEALAAYVPTSGETFEATIEVQ